MRQLSRGERWAFDLMTAILLGMLLIILLFTDRSNLFDPAYMLFWLGILYLIARRRELPLRAYLAVFILFLLHGAAIFMGYTGTFLLPLDKWMHLLAGIAFAIFFWDWLPAAPRGQRLVLVLLCVMGLEGISEITEFVGTFWFGMRGVGLAAMGTAAPAGTGILEAYDTHFDMLFNLAGTALALATSRLWGGEKASGQESARRTSKVSRETKE